MENQFVSYEQALKLKKLGFNQPCMAYYTVIPEDNIDWFTIPEQGFGTIRYGSNKDFNSKEFGGKGRVSAPTFMQAFRFFRDRGIHNAILPKQTPSNTIVYYRYEGKVKTDWNNCFETYEEAEIASLNKLIAIYKTQRR